MTIPEKLAGLNPAFLATPLYKEAITHRSATGSHNERLEFLGDAILGMIMAEYLFLHYPHLEEGDLSRLRSHLVRKETLAEIATENNLGDAILLGPGELKSGGYRRASILADTMEAILGAVFLEFGLDITRKFIHELYHSRLLSLPSAEDLKDPKSRLQELLQSMNIPVPEYFLESDDAALNTGEFKSVCQIKSLGILETGSGSSKRKSEQDAAFRAYNVVKATLVSH